AARAVRARKPAFASRYRTHQRFLGKATVRAATCARSSPYSSTSPATTVWPRFRRCVTRLRLTPDHESWVSASPSHRNRIFTGRRSPRRGEEPGPRDADGRRDEGDTPPGAAQHAAEPERVPRPA